MRRDERDFCGNGTRLGVSPLSLVFSCGETDLETSGKPGRKELARKPAGMRRTCLLARRRRADFNGRRRAERSVVERGSNCRARCRLELAPQSQSKRLVWRRWIEPLCHADLYIAIVGPVGRAENHPIYSYSGFFSSFFHSSFFLSSSVLLSFSYLLLTFFFYYYFFCV